MYMCVCVYIYVSMYICLCMYLCNTHTHTHTHRVSWLSYQKQCNGKRRVFSINSHGTECQYFKKLILNPFFTPYAKIKNNYRIIQQSHFWVYPKEMKPRSWRDICTPVLIAALFTTAKTWKQPKCPSNRWMDKEDVVYIYNGILLSHKKYWNIAICSNMDAPRDYHTEWSKSDRERQVSYIITYMWNLEKWYRWTYLQSRNRVTDVENKRMVTKGGKVAVGWIGRLGLTYIH